MVNNLNKIKYDLLFKYKKKYITLNINQTLYVIQIKYIKQFFIF